MFKRFKSLTIIVTVLVLLVGGSKFISDAAAIEGGEKSNDRVTTYHADSDEMFHKFYKRLLQEWNMRYETNNGPKQAHERKPKENVQKQYDKVEKEPNQDEPVNEDTVEERPIEQKEPIVEEEKQPEEQVERPAPVEPAPEYKQEQKQEQGELNAFERQMFELTNRERVNNGLQPLQVDYELSRVAREKSRDMAINFYFDHNSPVYGSPFDMMRAYGITYRAAGENIAKGQRTPEEVVQAWMNSPGHRANILNPNFTHIGVGFVENGNHWTQQFIGK